MKEKQPQNLKVTIPAGRKVDTTIEAAIITCRNFPYDIASISFLFNGVRIRVTEGSNKVNLMKSFWKRVYRRGRFPVGMAPDLSPY